MSFSGRDGAAHMLTANLDPRSLVRLAKDILFARGHHDIRITDGPGDGGRDIHSVAPRQGRHLTQSKWHRNTASVCSSSEVAELPLALVKLRYHTGAFITNARISPQAKREYLDNYPDLELEFLDGELIVSEVLSHPLLKAVWFDGAHIARVGISTAFPVLLRRHRGDVPVDICSGGGELAEEAWACAAQYLRVLHPGLRFRLRRATPTTEPFEPYRAPEPMSPKEGGLPFLFAAEVAVDGEVALTDLQNLSHDVARAMLCWRGEDLTGLSVRIGRPYVTPLGGESAGARIETDIDPITYIQTTESCDEETAWYGVDGQTYWSSETDARASEGEAIRLYAPRLDCALSYEIRSRLDARERMMRVARREMLERGWMGSVFALVPTSVTWGQTDIPPPDKKAEWPWDGRDLCGWMHWTLKGGLIPMQPDDEELAFLGLPSEQDEAARLDGIRSRLLATPGVDLIEPRNARYMAALIADDPLPDTEFDDYPTAYLAYHLDLLPSPMRPSAVIH